MPVYKDPGPVFRLYFAVTDDDNYPVQNYVTSDEEVTFGHSETRGTVGFEV